MANPWVSSPLEQNSSSLSNSPVPPDALAALGIQALKAGKISLPEAKATAKKIGLNPQTRAAASLPPGQADADTLTQPKAQWSAADIAAMTPPAAVSGNPFVMGFATQPEVQNKTDIKKSMARDVYKTPEQMKAEQALAMGYTPGQESPDQNNPFQQQLGGLRQLAAMNAAQADAGAKMSHLDLTPLLALADAQTGSHMASSYKAPEDKSQQVLQNAAAIQGKRGELLDSIKTAMGGAKAGTETTSVDTTRGEKTGAQGGIAATRAQKLVLDAAGKFDTDKILVPIQNTHNSLKRAISIMDGKTPVTGKSFNLLQQDLINAVSPGGAATEGKVNREMVNTLAAALNNIEARFGSVQDLRKEQPEVFAQLRGLINQVYADYSHAGLERTNELALNSKNIPNPLLQQTIQGKVQALTSKFNAPVPGSQPAAKSAAEMTNEELDAFLAQHGAK